MRTELSMSKVGDRAATESLKQLLSETRKDLDEKEITSNHLKKEIEKLHSRIEELHVRLHCISSY